MPELIPDVVVSLKWLVLCPVSVLDGQISLNISFSFYKLDCVASAEELPHEVTFCASLVVTSRELLEG